MFLSFYFLFYEQTTVLKRKNILFGVYRDVNVWPMARVEDPAVGQMSNFFGNVFYM